ncbi:hypothetical protein EU537_07590 [Candidatus Thorarchaeota archaeon]|nr:MAG: hypothetical protein EU537_07590 [Candidatus Thorarchaeota archaeon]
MIITVSTIVLMVLAILSLVLAFYGGHISLSITGDKNENSNGSQTAEQKYYLLGMIGLIVLAARLVAAPLFFWMLQSLVPYCPGAMCISGVVNVSEPFSSLDMALKLIVPALYGQWIFIEIANRRSKDLAMANLLAKSFALVLLPVLVVESVLDVLLVSLIQPVYAPCCSSVYDVEPPFSPSALFGPEVGIAIIVLTITLATIIIAIELIELPLNRRLITILTLGPLLGFSYLTAIHDTVAPVVLGLSSHHCPYCLFQEFPDTAVFAGLFWLGVVMSIWNVVLEFLWSRNGLSINQIDGVLALSRKVSAVCLIFSLTSLVSHLIVAS